jgi:proline iminopeptidase
MISRRRLIQFAAGGLPFLAGRSIAADRSADESGFVSVGGIEQWIAVQGRDKRNPAVLYLHGGPGEAQSPFLSRFLAWEKDFTVVNWDQRGSGRTFGRNGPSTPNMTLDRLIDDAIEIAEQLRARLSQRKVILVGQSAGSLIGVNVVKRRPDLFHAYVGTGQVVSFPLAVASQVKWARRQAAATGDQVALKALDDAEGLPEDRRLGAQAAAAKKWLLPPPDQIYAKMIDDFAGPDPASAKGDAADWIAGSAFMGRTLGGVLASIDLRTLGLDMPIPFFVVQGRDDHIVSNEAAQAYVESMKAPAKAYIAIEGGHFACFTNADQFVAALRKHVRPFAI